jgi:hypothetical protein
MTTKELIGKVAKLFNLKQQFISLSFEFQPDNCAEKLHIAIEEGDEEGYQHALTILPNYLRITVEMKIERMKEISISGERNCRRKKVVAEDIKREVGLHDDQGKGKKGYMDAKWTAKCDTLMEQDSSFLFEYDKLQAGVELAFRERRYLLNPFQLICPICGEVKCMGNMNQPVALIQHITTQHSTDAAVACTKRLKAWVQNHFISALQMDGEALLPEGLFNPTALLSTPRVRNAILTRDIA